MKKEYDYLINYIHDKGRGVAKVPVDKMISNRQDLKHIEEVLMEENNGNSPNLSIISYQLIGEIEKEEENASND